MPWSISDHANSDYAPGQHPWDSLYNGGPSSDVVPMNPRQQKLISQSRATGSLDCPDEVIRDTMTNPPMLDAGPARPEPTIGSVLDGSSLRPPTLYEAAPAMAGGNAVSRPAL